ncbi:hypothetical protein BBbe_10440 [Bartonella bovis 91-4]|uniref:Right handed beta helix domain-containing protein n=1 Tax=Bartonella bovis 91-4 TaxID=1094491 RepID=N6UDX8_9HYPH|nr:hypothetical protein [Bartonella bovis]ENN90769.1 hypothetical protein BBbe_10440 [Bartonella bovis 91-4]
MKGELGVKVMGTGTADLTKVTITGEGSGKGTGVIMGGTKMMTMTNVDISKVEKGVDVQKGKLEMMGGTVTFTGERGNWGVHVQKAATANLMDVTIKGEGGQGMGLYVEGTATMNGGEISNVESGVYATGMGNLKMDGTTITFKNGVGSYGVRVGELVTADLTSVTITGASGGTGTGVIMDGKTLEMTNVDISQVQTGVEVTSGNLTVSGGTMTGVQTGITMSGSGTLMVSGAKITFEGAGHGVKVGGTATANITGATITGGGSGQGMGVIMGGKMLGMSGGRFQVLRRRC